MCCTTVFFYKKQVRLEGVYFVEGGVERSGKYFSKIIGFSENTQKCSKFSDYILVLRRRRGHKNDVPIDEFVVAVISRCDCSIIVIGQECMANPAGPLLGGTLGAMVETAIAVVCMVESLNKNRFSI